MHRGVDEVRTDPIECRRQARSVLQVRPDLCTVAGYPAQYMAKIQPGLDDTHRLGGGLPTESANCLDRDGWNEPFGVRGGASIQQHPVRANPTQLTGYRQATGDHNAQPGAQCGAQAGVQSLPDQLRARSLLDLAGSFRALKLVRLRLEVGEQAVPPHAASALLPRTIHSIEALALTVVAELRYTLMDANEGNRMKYRLTLGLLLVSDIATIRQLWPSSSAVAHGVRAPHRWVAAGGADRAVLVLAQAAVCLAAVWLGVGLLAVLTAGLPGTAGRTGDWLARRALPVALYRLCAAAVGVSVLAGPVTAGAAAVATERPTGWGVVSAIADPPPPAWPTGGSVPAPTWPQGPGAPATAPIPPTRAAPPTVGAPSSPSASGPVTVRPGDSLWLIAARRLGSGTAPIQIALACREWYATNRALIGDDPDLIRPGQVLVDPGARSASAGSNTEGR